MLNLHYFRWVFLTRHFIFNTCRQFAYINLQWWALSIVIMWVSLCQIILMQLTYFFTPIVNSKIFILDTTDLPHILIVYCFYCYLIKTIVTSWSNDDYMLATSNQNFCKITHLLHLQPADHYKTQLEYVKKNR